MAREGQRQRRLDSSTDPAYTGPSLDTSDSEQQTQAIWLAALFPLVFVLGMILGKLVAPGPYQAVIREDHLVEYATAFVYLIACALALRLAVDLVRNDERVHASLYAIWRPGWP